MKAPITERESGLWEPCPSWPGRLLQSPLPRAACPSALSQAPLPSNLSTTPGGRGRATSPRARSRPPSLTHAHGQALCRKHREQEQGLGPLPDNRAGPRATGLGRGTLHRSYRRRAVTAWKDTHAAVLKRLGSERVSGSIPTIPLQLEIQYLLSASSKGWNINNYHPRE